MPLFSFDFLQLLPKIQIWQPIYDFGVVFPKDQHGDIGSAICTFPKMQVVHSALRPLNLFEFATELCKFKWCHALYGFGVENCRDFNGDVHVVFYATQVDMV